MLKFWIFFLILTVQACAWPFGLDDEERISRLSLKISESVEKLKSADEELWKNLLRTRDGMKRDIDALTYKMNEVITEVNQLKIKIARYF